MPSIRSSSDLRNNDNEISQETYERLIGKFELYKLIDEGIDEMKEKKVRSFREALADIQKVWLMLLKIVLLPSKKWKQIFRATAPAV